MNIVSGNILLTFLTDNDVTTTLKISLENYAGNITFIFLHWEIGNTILYFRLSFDPYMNISFFQPESHFFHSESIQS